MENKIMVIFLSLTLFLGIQKTVRAESAKDNSQNNELKGFSNTEANYLNMKFHDNPKPTGDKINYPYVVVNNDNETIKPLVYYDEKNKIIFYVESDGRHITALNQKGEILWYRNPFVDSKLKPYRYSKPVIYYIGKSDKESESIGIDFNSSQFGDLNIMTGDFHFEGQD